MALAACLLLPWTGATEEPSLAALFDRLGAYETWVLGKDGQKYTYVHTRKLQLDSKGAVTIVETVRSGSETWTNTFGFNAGDLGDLRVNEREATANAPASLELEFDCNWRSGSEFGVLAPREPSLSGSAGMNPPSPPAGSAPLGKRECITSTELATGSKATPTSSFSLQFSPAAREAVERVAAAFKALAGKPAR